MAEETIAAEVVPTDVAHAGKAAKALQQRGFRVLDVGTSISVTAPRATWEHAFGVVFVSGTKTVQPEIGRAVAYLRGDPDTLRVPADLEALIADVAFVEPPDLH